LVLINVEIKAHFVALFTTVHRRHHPNYDVHWPLHRYGLNLVPNFSGQFSSSFSSSSRFSHRLKRSTHQGFIFRDVLRAGIAQPVLETGYGLDGRGVGVRVPVGARFFSSQCRPNLFWGPSSHLSNGYRGLFPKWVSGQGVRLTTPTGAQVKNTWIYTSTPPYVFM
jgi:hypothetical protein